MIFLTTAPRLIPKIVLLRHMSEKFPSGKKEWIENIEIFTFILSNEDGKILSSTIGDLPEEELKNLLENITKYDDNLNLLQIMASNKTILQVGFMTKLAKYLLERKKIPPKALSGFEAFTTSLSNEDGKILSSTIGDLPEEELKNVLEIITKYDDNLNLLQIMASNKTIFSEGFMTTLAKSLLQRKKIPPNALSGFAKCNTLTFHSFLKIFNRSHFAETNKNNLEIILSDTFNYSPDDIYVHVLHEKNIYEKDGPQEQSLLIKWANQTSPNWITYCLTNVRFQTSILEKLLEDPDQKNNSPLMHIIHAGDSLGNLIFNF